MKILTVREPWASLIIYGATNKKGAHAYKDIENRKWIPSEKMKGVRIAIHAGQSTAYLGDTLRYLEEAYRISLDKTDLTFGAVLGSVELVTWVAKSKSKWFEGPVGFVLKEPFAYPKPIPCKGMLGFFTNEEIAKTIERYERLRLKAMPATSGR